MVPLRDNNPTHIVPVVTYGLIGLNVLAFIYELSLTGEELNSFFQVWAVVPQLLTRSFQGLPTGLPFPAWITLITSQFLHGGFLHIAGNMLFLWIFGNNVEDKLGHLKFIVFYLTCGVLAGLAQWYFSALSTTPSLGASGAIAGVMGAYILRFPQAEITTLIPLGFLFWTARVPAIFFLGFWFIQQAFYSVASLEVTTNVGMSGGGIAYWAHAGGFVFGAVLGPLLGLFSDHRRSRD
ncbi:rhomboid family intramembrane serine protease [Lyngbya confervoides]|uniref:Rhomboid family intramembrane serine protease n=1 Tax=Lyngbya confervoides BDU141951 TaxID=1574623 RepID=A0ABD4T6I6_9CYAN|nr:rhomboid family intramembrane serine protease [Lyngbya confervoides]MCM1984256.1 rhomboid family intramembrane serine protease [Lyngbya confervoides BDU141951]